LPDRPAAGGQDGERASVLLDFHTRARAVEAIEATYPGIRREDIHVWTLRGRRG